jgi:hypothetical protein
MPQKWACAEIDAEGVDDAGDEGELFGGADGAADAGGVVGGGLARQASMYSRASAR